MEPEKAYPRCSTVVSGSVLRSGPTPPLVPPTLFDRIASLLRRSRWSCPSLNAVDVRPPAEIMAYRAFSENVCAEFDVDPTDASCLPGATIPTTPTCSIGGGTKLHKAVRVMGALEAMRSEATAGDLGPNNAAFKPYKHEQGQAHTAADDQTREHAAGTDVRRAGGLGGDDYPAGSSDGGTVSTFLTAVGGSSLATQASIVEPVKGIADAPDNRGQLRKRGTDVMTNAEVTPAAFETAVGNGETVRAGATGSSIEGARQTGLGRLWERGRYPSDSFDEQRTNLTSAR